MNWGPSVWLIAFWVLFMTNYTTGNSFDIEIWYNDLIHVNTFAKCQTKFFQIKKKSNNSLYWHQVKIEEEEKKWQKPAVTLLLSLSDYQITAKKQLKLVTLPEFAIQKSPTKFQIAINLFQFKQMNNKKSPVLIWIWSVCKCVRNCVLYICSTRFDRSNIYFINI